MSTQVNTFTSLDDGYTAAEWEAEQAEVAANIAQTSEVPAMCGDPCFAPRSLRPRRTGRAQAVPTVPTVDQIIGGGLPSGGWTPGIGIPDPVRPADHLPDPDVILTPPDEQPVYREEARVREHGRRPCHKVPDHRPSWEVRWRTPQSLGLPWCGQEFVLVGPPDEMVPGTHVTVTHKNGATSLAYVASLGPRTTCGGRVGFTR
ncbi:MULTISPECIES: hypothetical protein [unclassified Gordonia (in: high G+C Gram-positive bacteria)]|uniref:hypothetical protein n=1 Tax=unclassified Gordonia (in: high G+C Gram-positive bacteria) TaxID=2657482 RepID=UPI0025BD1456|nr:hypothetical protein [Gordonia sp. UBA7599]